MHFKWVMPIFLIRNAPFLEKVFINFDEYKTTRTCDNLNSTALEMSDKSLVTLYGEFIDDIFPKSELRRKCSPVVFPKASLYRCFSDLRNFD